MCIFSVIVQRPSPIWRWGPDSSRRSLRGEALPCAGETAACLSHRWRNEVWNWRVTTTWDTKHWADVILHVIWAQISLSVVFNFRFLSQWQLCRFWTQLTYWLVQQWERSLLSIHGSNPGTNHFNSSASLRWTSIDSWLNWKWLCQNCIFSTSFLTICNVFFTFYWKSPDCKTHVSVLIQTGKLTCQIIFSHFCALQMF